MEIGAEDDVNLSGVNLSIFFINNVVKKYELTKQNGLYILDLGQPTFKVDKFRVTVTDTSQNTLDYEWSMPNGIIRASGGGGPIKISVSPPRNIIDYIVSLINNFFRKE